MDHLTNWKIKKKKKGERGNFALHWGDAGHGDERAVSMASSGGCHRQDLQDVCWTPAAELSWPDGLEQTFQFEPTKASDAILGLGAETTDPGQEGHVQASMPGSRRSRARKGVSGRLYKCTHGTELIAISQDGGRCRWGWAAARWLEE